MDLYLLDLLDFTLRMYHMYHYYIALNLDANGMSLLLVKEKASLGFLNGRHPRA